MPRKSPPKKTVCFSSAISSLDFIRNKVFVRFSLGFRLPFAFLNPKVVQSTSRFDG
jgi:hypothetical protein